MKKTKDLEKESEEIAADGDEQELFEAAEELEMAIETKKVPHRLDEEAEKLAPTEEIELLQDLGLKLPEQISKKKIPYEIYPRAIYVFVENSLG